MAISYWQNITVPSHLESYIPILLSKLQIIIDESAKLTYPQYPCSFEKQTQLMINEAEEQILNREKFLLKSLEELPQPSATAAPYTLEAHPQTETAEQETRREVIQWAVIKIDLEQIPSLLNIVMQGQRRLSESKYSNEQVNDVSDAILYAGNRVTSYFLLELQKFLTELLESDNPLLPLNKALEIARLVPSDKFRDLLPTKLRQLTFPAEVQQQVTKLAMLEVLKEKYKDLKKKTRFNGKKVPPFIAVPLDKYKQAIILLVEELKKIDVIVTVNLD